MIRLAWCGVALAWFAGCGPSTFEASKVWSAREFAANGRNNKNFGLLSSKKLGVLSGDPIPWRSKPFESQDTLQAPGVRGLPLWPAFAEGQTASVIITEIWYHHPTPWVQPVYQFRTGDQPRTDLKGVFAVNVNSTFYTPYWRAELATVPADTGPTTFTSVPAILNANLEVHPSVMVICPIVPADVNVAMAEGETTPRRPITGEPAPFPSQHAQAWVDGVVVDYLPLGYDRQTVNERGLPDESPMYFFVKTAGAEQLPFSLPPVLPDAPTRHSLMRRYDVALDSTHGVFVPANRPELRALLSGEGAPVPDVDPAITDDAAKPYILRVATKPSCFLSAATFPNGCGWLDSQAALEAAIGQDVRVPTEALLTVTTLQVGATP